EAMAMERSVLAPAITGIPELIRDGRTGFLYEPESMDDFLATLIAIREQGHSVNHVRQAARRHIESNFNRTRNLQLFAADFLRRVVAQAEPRELLDANPVLQQI